MKIHKKKNKIDIQEEQEAPQVSRLHRLGPDGYLVNTRSRRVTPGPFQHRHCASSDPLSAATFTVSSVLWSAATVTPQWNSHCASSDPWSTAIHQRLDLGSGQHPNYGGIQQHLVNCNIITRPGAYILLS